MGGFAGGLLSGIQGVQTMAQQRRENQYRQDALALDRQRLSQQAESERRRAAQEDRRFDLDTRRLAFDEKDYDFRLRSYEEGADQRRATYEGTLLSNQSQALANAKAADERNAARRAERGAVNNEIIRGYQALNILDPTDPTRFNREAVRAGIERGDKPYVDLLLAAATNSGSLPEGTVAESIQPLPNGGYAVTVRNADGSQGAVTEDASSRPDSRVVEFSPGRLAGIADLTYKTTVLSNQGVYDLSAYRGMENLINVEDEAAANDARIADRLAEISYQREVLGAMPNAGAQRAAFNAIAAAETPEEAAQVTDAIADDVGVPKRQRPSAKPAESAQPERFSYGAAVDADPFLKQFRAPEVAQQAESVVSQTEGMSTQEVAAAVESGEVTVTPDLMSETKRIMEDAEIRELRDLKRLDTKRRALARAVILASTADPNMRTRMSDAIENLFDGGSPSMSRKDVETIRQNDETLRLRGLELRQRLREYETKQDDDAQARLDKAVQAGAALQEGALAQFFGENGTENNLNAKTAKQFARTVLAPYAAKTTAAASPEEAEAYRRSLNTALSLTIAGLAAEEEGGVYETIVSFFRGDAIDRTTGSDFDLSRVEMETKGGRPSRFYYLGPEGERLDEGFPAKDLQRLDSMVYNLVVQQVLKNKKRAASRAGQ